MLDNKTSQKCPRGVHQRFLLHPFVKSVRVCVSSHYNVFVVVRISLFLYFFETYCQ